jgi:hypothetical protein
VEEWRRGREGRGVERGSRCPFIGWRRKGRRRGEAVAELGRPAINGGGDGSVEGAITREGKG